MRTTAFKGQGRLQPLGLCLAALLLSAGVLSAGILPAAAFERAPLPSEAPMESCPSQGANFFRIPGTTTCLRLSGRVRAGIDAGPGRTAAPVQGRVSVDARGDSALGPVRSFVRIEAGAR